MPLPVLLQGFVDRVDQREDLVEALIDKTHCLVTGVPGSGRRTLIRAAAQQIEVQLLEVDCLRTTSPQQFLQVFGNVITSTFTNAKALAFLQAWSLTHPVTLESSVPGRARFVWHVASGKEWPLLRALLDLPQQLSQGLDCPLGVVLQNVAHIRSWDRQERWEVSLSQVMEQQNQVSYILVTAMAEAWGQNYALRTIALSPLSNDELRPWLVAEMAAFGLKLDLETHAADLFLSYVQGHLGDAIALAKRVCLEYNATHSSTPGLLQGHHIHRSMVALITDISVTFESLLLLLPPSQIRVLESLALDPTDSPHARNYIQKHQLSRGGSLQGALNSLQQKGLIYGPQYSYRVALPFLDFWLKQRLI
ncbi:MAG: ATP-binding protein [Thermosynechococcaceae cyanobacterium]